MASLTIRNIPEDAKLRFRQVAAAHGRSMEEHLRQMVIEAEFGNAVLPAGRVAAGHVAEVRQTFQHEPSREDNVRELIRIANGSRESAADTGKYAEIRFMTAKDAMAELRRLANGVGLDLPPRMNTRLEAPDF
jgi:plasmid stability protein